MACRKVRYYFQDVAGLNFDLKTARSKEESALNKSNQSASFMRSVFMDLVFSSLLSYCNYEKKVDQRMADF
jgi:hypothetical protein